MIKIGVKNFRSFKEYSAVQVKPITVFVGSNNSGKSSFLRTFPLIKQTIQTKTAEPILWYGDQVDFGSFEESITRGSQDEFVNFTISSDRFISLSRFFRSEYDAKSQDINVSIKVLKRQVQEVSIIFEGQKIEISFNDNNSIKKIYINNQEMDNTEYDTYLDYSSILPLINFKSTKEQRFMYRRYLFYNEFYKSIDFLKKKLHSKTSKETIRELLQRINSYRKKDILTIIKKTNKLESLNKYTQDWNTANEEFNELNNLYIYDLLPQIIEETNEFILGYYRNVEYIKPLRAFAERFYRKQGLQLDNIDSSGTNLPMYIESLNESKRENFNIWLQENFGFTILSEFDAGHLSLVLVKDNEKFNLADTGFGFSQILPIIVLLWKTSFDIDNRRDGENYLLSNYPITIVIEQPELHLHPKFQSLLVNSIVKLINNSNKKINIIFETHSETIINNLGKLVFTKQIDSNDISIFIFEKVNGLSTIKESHFDEEGYLTNWPIGFFSFN